MRRFYCMKLMVKARYWSTPAVRRCCIARDGRSAEAPFNGQYAVLHGDTVTVFAETEEFLAVERFSAETLEETDLFALPVTSGLRFAESDSAGRLYAVTYGAPSTLQVFDAAGEPLTEFIFEDKIFGIQTVDSTLYVLLSGKCRADFACGKYADTFRHGVYLCAGCAAV